MKTKFKVGQLLVAVESPLLKIRIEEIHNNEKTYLIKYIETETRDADYLGRIRPESIDVIEYHFRLDINTTTIWDQLND